MASNPHHDDISDIRRFYDASIQAEEERLARHQLERDLTWRYLDTYLSGTGEILEIGAATGAYTLGLARRGYQVTAVDISAAMTAFREEKLARAGLDDRVEHLIADARDLRALAGRAFDAALIMGPLYHLVYESDRRRVLSQTFELLKPGGLVFSTFISRTGIMGDLMATLPEWIEQEDEVRAVLEQGYLPKDKTRGGFRGYFARVDEIAPLHESVGFETLILAALEPQMTSSDDDNYNRLTGAQRRAWLDLWYELSTDPHLLGSSRHLLYIGHKQKDQS
ncbi:MAG TPA: class I SAM-dependent methyltransferase [Anaerolineae bacterium]|nr:class I SAM-dependent methyltransferase [Anaerolineae bacterium]